MTNPPPNQPPNNGGRIVGIVNAARALTLTNAAVIVILLFALVPAYVVYRLVTDPDLLDRFLSSYAAVGAEGPCRIIKARERSEHYTWAITSGFAFEGNQRWTLGTVMTRQPTDEEIRSNCAILQAIIDFMHGDAAPPDIIWQTKDIQGREGEKGER
jgi:hypothetical protein